MTFTKVAKFKYNNKTYQMFQTNKGQIAFLEVINENEYGYPEYSEFCGIIKLFCTDQESRSFFLGKKLPKFNFIPKIKYKMSLIMLTSSLILSILSGCTSDPNFYYGNYANEDPLDSFGYAVEETYDYEYSYDEEYVNADYYMTDDYEIIKSSQYISLFNNKYYDQLFETESISLDEIYSVIDDNRQIPKDYKDFIKGFALRIQTAHPDIDLRVFHHNLKTLKIVLETQDNIELNSGGLASYNHEENTLTISKTADVYNNPTSKIIFAHELGHLFNNCKLQKDGWDIKITFNYGNRGMYTKEGLDVILTSELYKDEPGVDEMDSLGYAITANNMRVIVDSLPNYDITDSVNHNIYYLQDKLDEYMGDEMEASRLVELLELQWIEYSSELIEVDVQDYIDLYQYITRLYIKSNLTPNMTYSEIQEHQERLIYTLSKGVVNPAYVYIDVIEESFTEYININGIETVSYTK